jgi:citrate synthase
MAQWEEMLRDPETKIARPRQIYLGPAPRDYIAMEERETTRRKAAGSRSD